MVDGDNQKWRPVSGFDSHGRLIKSGIDVVDWDRVVGVSSVATDIDNNCQLTIGIGQRFSVDEVGDGLIEVNAVDKDIGFLRLASYQFTRRSLLTLNNLIERTALGGLGHIPLQDVFSRDTGFKAQINSSPPTSSQGADDQHSRFPSTLLDYFQ